MRKFACALAVVAMVGLLAGAAALRGPCDLKTVEPGLYCAKCDKLLEKTDVKGAKCGKCEEKVKSVQVCVKECFMGCHKGPQAKAYN